MFPIVSKKKLPHLYAKLSSTTLFFFLSIIALLPFIDLPSIEATNSYSTQFFKLSKNQQTLIAPHLLSESHPIKKTLDELFIDSTVINTHKTLAQAGFKVLFTQTKSGILVVRHKKIKGFLIKLYLNSAKKWQSTGWRNLTTRCIVAKKIQSIIKKNKIKNFIVPKKWLYLVPARHKRNQPVVLLVKDMHIYNREDSFKVWKNLKSKKTLAELYQILGRGYGSAFLTGNIPYTCMGKFAFIDTEFEKRNIPLNHANRFLSRPMIKYWKILQKKRQVDSHKKLKIDFLRN